MNAFPKPERTVAHGSGWSVRTIIVLFACLNSGEPLAVVAETTAVPTVQYNRDVRPILSDKCFHCHGPDSGARQADLRLDEHGAATADRGGHRAILPGEPVRSELVRRVSSKNDDERMPPPDSSPGLTAVEIDILRRWIKTGAEYQTHWSFIPPKRPALPKVADPSWPKNSIDRFVMTRLDQQQQPSTEADSAILIRRVSLDLTGLPPTTEEIIAFEKAFEHTPVAAYSTLIDRLLKSPRYGEHMAVSWLDAARYADTNGYFTDNERSMWPWRDWVINAFNKNMPFDQFTIEQLAGDLLPNATIDQKIATGFNRNHMVNNETGIIEEEFRIYYVVDRSDTTATVWMGLTIACARCHDHKYDPVSQKDFYRFFALFNNVPERGLSGSGGNSTPTLKVPANELQNRLHKIRYEVADAERKFASVKQQLDIKQAAWEAIAIDSLSADDITGLTAHLSLDTNFESEATTGSVGIAPGLLGNAAKFNGDGCVRFPGVGDFDHDNAFTVGAWVHAESAGCVVSKMDDAKEMQGFDITLRKGKVIVNLVHGWNRNGIRVVTKSSIPTRQWQHLMMSYDGSDRAKGVTVYADGVPQDVEIIHDSLTGTMRNSEPFRIGRRQASASLKGLVDDVRIYDRRLSDAEVSDLVSSQLIRGVLSKPVSKRSDSLKRKLRAWFISHRADSRIAELRAGLDRLRQEASSLAKSVPTTMVMQEQEDPRPAFVLLRGEYDQPGEKVTAGFPGFVSQNDDSRNHAGARLDRLDLAKWLVDPSHPLTARVTVNRLWQQLFGVGIVKTVDDFGTQGEWPSHPELLDWLAIELIESGWDIQHILKLMVTSATYRQTSNAPSESFANDPENRLLARGPRFRMRAEMLRDNALAISGLLVEKIGGPSVKPYQPAGLWTAVTYDADSKYTADKGNSLYRRSLYTFWKRQSPPPNMLVFDAPTRETCTAQRSQTNTPLQALALMNDPTFVEASRKLAERMMTLPADSSSDRITFVFRLATARKPTSDEIQILLDVFEVQKAAFLKRPDDAVQLLTVGDSKRNQSLDAATLGAWTTTASIILTLDETFTKR